MHLPGKRPIKPRALSTQERFWIREILEHNPKWADVDIGATQVVAECDCGECKTVFLDSSSPQNPSLSGTKGYVGRIEIRSYDDFGITVALDQLDGKLSGLYVNAIDLREPGDRPFPEQWQEKGHIVISM
jgi:hypothetical protein